jgi:hypothetical protein
VTVWAASKGLTAARDAFHLHDVAVAGGHDVGLHGVPRRLDDVLGRPHAVQRLVRAEAGAAPQPLRAVRARRTLLRLRCSIITSNVCLYIISESLQCVQQHPGVTTTVPLSLDHKEVALFQMKGFTQA